MTLDEANLTIDYLKEMQEQYIEGEGYERHPLPEWYALDKAIETIEQTTWIPIEWKPFGKNGYPKPEDEYKHFLTIDDKGEITIQEFLLSLDEEPQPYFTGMRKIIAWMPRPKPYKAESKE